jgi:hypothetical protein
MCSAKVFTMGELVNRIMFFVVNDHLNRSPDCWDAHLQNPKSGSAVSHYPVLLSSSDRRNLYDLSRVNYCFYVETSRYLWQDLEFGYGQETRWRRVASILIANNRCETRTPLPLAQYVKRLTVHNIEITSQELECVKFMQSLSALTIISVSGITAQDILRLMAEWKLFGVPRIRQLTLVSCIESDICAPAVIETILQLCGRYLSKLDLTGDDTRIQRLLDEGYRSETTDDEADEPEWILLNGTGPLNLPPARLLFPDLVAIYCLSITDLCLAHVDISLDSIRRMCNACPQLQSISISHLRGFTNEMGQFIMILPRLANLCVCQNDANDDFFEFTTSNSNLVSVEITNTRITDTAIDRLISNCLHLEQLDISYSRLVTSESLLSFKRAYCLRQLNLFGCMAMDSIQIRQFFVDIAECPRRQYALNVFGTSFLNGL